MTEQTVTNKSAAEVAVQTAWIARTNLAYGAAGAVALLQFSSAASLKSFAVGWFLSVLNLEIIRRLSSMLFLAYDGSRLGALFYFILFGKFAFWGLVMALFVSANWIQALPFVAGMGTIFIAGAGLGMKELVYAS